MAGATSTKNAERLLEYVRETGIDLVWVLYPHPHAGHFSAARWVKQQTGASTAIGEKVTGIQDLWQGIYNLPFDFAKDGSQWDRVFADGDEFMVGNLPVKVMFSPGRTLASQGLNPRFNARLEVPIFEKVAQQVHIGRMLTWKNAKNGQYWINMLCDCAFPKIGRMPIDSVDQPEVRTA